MDLLFVTQIVAFSAAIFCIAAFGIRLQRFTKLALPGDRSTPKGNPAGGVAYALTLGMMPWAKESTRRHALAYLRGVGFHATVFLSFVVFLASPWLGKIPGTVRQLLALLIALGALCALLGFVSRLFEKHLKNLSTPDDFFAILLVSLFLTISAIAIWNLAFLPAFYLVSACIFLYMPLGKIRHCIYFAFSRIFFGKFFGRRGIFPQPRQEVRA